MHRRTFSGDVQLMSSLPEQTPSAAAPRTPFHDEYTPVSARLPRTKGANDMVRDSIVSNGNMPSPKTAQRAHDDRLLLADDDNEPAHANGDIEEHAGLLDRRRESDLEDGSGPKTNGSRNAWN